MFTKPAITLNTRCRRNEFSSTKDRFGVGGTKQAKSFEITGCENHRKFRHVTCGMKADGGRRAWRPRPSPPEKSVEVNHEGANLNGGCFDCCFDLFRPSYRSRSFSCSTEHQLRQQPRSDGDPGRSSRSLASWLFPSWIFPSWLSASRLPVPSAAPPRAWVLSSGDCSPARCDSVSVLSVRLSQWLWLLPWWSERQYRAIGVLGRLLVSLIFCPRQPVFVSLRLPRRRRRGRGIRRGRSEERQFRSPRGTVHVRWSLSGQPLHFRRSTN